MKAFYTQVILLIPFVGFGQLTYIPDDNFEQALIDLGYDNILDNYVNTSNINDILNLNISNNNISNLTGIEDFIELESLDASSNDIISIDVGQNLELTDLYLDNNQLTTIDVSQNTDLENLFLRFNSLTTVVLNNPNMWQATFSGNQLISLDISSFNCNSFAELTISEAGWLEPIEDNPNLDCILVNDSSCWNINFNWSINDNQFFSENCFKTSFLLENNFSQKKLKKITNLLGQKTPIRKNSPMLFNYYDGSVEKKVILK